jgi:hypothetical protein
MLYLEKDLNSIVFTSENFKLNYNYMPEIVYALRELDPKKTLHFVIDIEHAPAVFILYFRQLKQQDNTLDLRMYFRDKSLILKDILKKYTIDFYDIGDYPFDLPSDENVVEEKNPFNELDATGWEAKSKIDNKEETDYTSKGN